MLTLCIGVTSSLDNLAVTLSCAPPVPSPPLPSPKLTKLRSIVRDARNGSSIAGSASNASLQQQPSSPIYPVRCNIRVHSPFPTRVHTRPPS